MAGGEHMMIWAGRFISDTLMWGYEREGSYVSCSHLRDVVSREVHSWWITSVGLWTGRSV